MKVRSGIILDKGFSVLVYGDGGAGKSTLAADMPKPIFFDLDRNGTAMLSVDRALNSDGEPIATWQDVKECVDWMLSNEHPYKTVVVDTVDALERLIHEHLCEKGNVESIEDYEKGYGRGHAATLDEVRSFFAKLTVLQNKGINICLIGHKKVATAKNPEGKDWERIEPKCNGKLAGFLMETLDAVLYVSHHIVLDTSKDGRRTKAIGGDTRIVFTENSGSHFAKNRYMMPEKLRLNWNDISFHMNMTPEGLVKRIEFKLQEMKDNKILKDDVEQKVRASVETNRTDTQKLKLVLQRINEISEAK